MVTKFVKDYVHKLSRGMVTLTDDEAKELINTVTRQQLSKNTGATATLRRCTGALYESEFVRVLKTTNEEITKQIRAALQVGPQYGYIYYLYNDQEEFEGKIFSNNPNLFD